MHQNEYNILRTRVLFRGELQFKSNTTHTTPHYLSLSHLTYSLDLDTNFFFIQKEEIHLNKLLISDNRKNIWTFFARPVNRLGGVSHSFITFINQSFSSSFFLLPLQVTHFYLLYFWSLTFIPHPWLTHNTIHSIMQYLFHFHTHHPMFHYTPLGSKHWPPFYTFLSSSIFAKDRTKIFKFTYPPFFHFSA